MDNNKFQKLFLDKLSSSIKKEFNNSYFLQELYTKFSEENKKETDKLKCSNSILLQTFKELGEVYGIKPNIGAHALDLEGDVIKFKDCISSLSQATKPKQRYLCFSGTSEFGNSFCKCILEKNYKDVEDTITDNYPDSLEHLYIETSNLMVALSARTKTPISDLMYMQEGDLLTKIYTFFQEIVRDDGVSLQLYSECIESLIDTSRHSGRAILWVNI